MWARALLVLACLIAPLAASAQEDDGSRLERFLESQLSDGDTRQVRIEGFAGALSSTATLDRLIISDADGDWLILEDAVLDWNRSAIFSRELEVNQLTAARMEIIRPPLPDPDSLPAAEAQPFALPELPLRILVNRFAIDELVLGEEVIGLPAILSLEGSARLADGAGEAQLDLLRLDGPEGRFSLDAAYDNADTDLSVSLVLEEDAGGLAVELLGIPGRPDLRLSIEGAGPLDDITADIALATEGVDRIQGQIVSGSDSDGAQTVVADIAGDIRPLLAPAYREFFGEELTLSTRITRIEGVSTELEALELRSAALNLDGALSLDAVGLPLRVALTAEILSPDGETVQLPLGGEARVSGATLALDYDRAEGDTYTLVADLRDLRTGDVSVTAARLVLGGSLGLESGAVQSTTAALTLAASGLDHRDPAMAEALGQALDLSADLTWTRDAPIVLSDLSLTSGQLALNGGAAALPQDGRIDVTLDLDALAGDLSRFAAIAGQPLDGAVELALTGTVEPLSGAFDLELDGTAEDLIVADAVPPELLAGRTLLSLNAARDTTGARIRNLVLENPELSLTGQASVTSRDTAASAEFTLREVGLFTEALNGPITARADVARTGTAPFDIAAEITGPSEIAANLEGTADAESGDFSLSLAASSRDLDVGFGVPPELLAGRTEVSVVAARQGDTLSLRDLTVLNPALSLTGMAEITGGDSLIETDFTLTDIGLFTDILNGPVTASAMAERTGTDPFEIVVGLSGPNDITAALRGTASPDTGDFALALDGSARDIDIGNGVPRQLLAGETVVSLAAARRDGVLTVTDLNLQNTELSLTGEASIGPDTSRVSTDLRLRNVGLFTSALSGPVTAQATADRAGSDPWRISADLGGPGGMQANVAGRVGLPDGSADLTARGQAPLALANRFIAPRSVAGTLQFDLALRGQPGLGALSGSLTANDARISAPTLGIAVEGLSLNGQLSSGRMSLNANGQLASGGDLSAEGSLNLASPGIDGDIQVTLVNGRLVDPTLYEALVSRADIRVSGALARQRTISGQITLGESEIRVPESGLGGSAAIPEIRHVGETAPERQTRSFAGLLGRTSGGPGGSGGGGGTELDLTVTAPARIFLRGRGIDAEFGGSIRLFGTTDNVIPTGRFELIRGRLSILGTRLDFVEGAATLQGSFTPFLDLTATSQSGGYRIIIGVEGPASEPAITFSSDPGLPEDEVLAQLLFGRSVSGLSPVQLLQLADAAASLAGGSTNAGFLSNLRDNLGLDDLDLSTDAEGNAAVRAGRYLSDNIYTDVTVGAGGSADLSLNIDLTPDITARGSVSSDGGSSLGVFFERDY